MQKEYSTAEWPGKKLLEQTEQLEPVCIWVKIEFTSLTILGPMEFFIKLLVHTIKSEWSIVYIEGS